MISSLTNLFIESSLLANEPARLKTVFYFSLFCVDVCVKEQKWNCTAAGELPATLIGHARNYTAHRSD